MPNLRTIIHRPKAERGLMYREPFNKYDLTLFSYPSFFVLYYSPPIDRFLNSFKRMPSSFSHPGRCYHGLRELRNTVGITRWYYSMHVGKCERSMRTTRGNSFHTQGWCTRICGTFVGYIRYIWARFMWHSLLVAGGLGLF